MAEVTLPQRLGLNLFKLKQERRDAEAQNLKKKRAHLRLSSNP